ncbi:TetR/AcrR family transcriptional regulator [Neotamlana laminarinivorans]|uniref:TetR/AcrR family transcriptional regulator n=1 Tax=Neotamlana laminarinivorans TaxID=2883124 RepID=A0A9X1I017_9FLAO|nr:TetR/AcrR family transcriptional regulator [Tamlana laminarinivorans]MCB4798470.1 TetR/AcrR family transcriptional regulator [Tamlana laminarinivorans]
MKENILNTAVDLFLNYGFKSVTMDDIANTQGISKKTIYQYFKNKTVLVEASVNHLFQTISGGINGICSLQKNPIDEIYEIKNFLMRNLKDEKSSPQYQLEKYYPKIYKEVKHKQMCVMQECIRENLKRGQLSGLFRNNLNLEFVTKIYFTCMMALKDKALFPLEHFSMQELMDNYTEYHLQGICTSKGLEYLNNYLEINQQTINK